MKPHERRVLCASCDQPFNKGTRHLGEAKKGPRGKRIHKNQDCLIVDLRKHLEEEGKIATEFTTGEGNGLSDSDDQELALDTH